MTEQQGLVAAHILDGRGGGRGVGWPEIEAWTPEQGVLWVHLQRGAENADAWLRDRSGLDPVVVDALLAEETRPRAVAIGRGLLVILRGVNLNPGADPEDMVSLRMWIDAERIVSVRLRRLMAVQDIRESLARGSGPTAPGDFLVDIATRLVERMGPVIDDLDDRTDELEDRMLTGESREMRKTLAGIRHQAIVLRRYLAPQRDATARLQSEEQPWIDTREKARLREVTDRVVRYIEDLDSVRDRAAVIQDELASRLSEQMNRTMYHLTVVASIMLPLGFLTGLLGINVGGIPGSENPWGFAAVCAILAAVVAVQVVLFRRLRWL